MRGRGEVILVLKMWRIRRFISKCIILCVQPGLPEVEEFRQSLLNSDPYVRRHG
ncbi:unnamed protein product, partial [Brassica rapa subsp. trilocularis]